MFLLLNIVPFVLIRACNPYESIIDNISSNCGCNKASPPVKLMISILKDFSELRAAGRAAEAAKLQRRVAEAQKTISLYNTGVNI